MPLVKAEDFYNILYQTQIRPEETQVENLSVYLQLSPSFPELFKIKQITKTLDAMQQNEKFMQAIQDDLAEDMENDAEDEDYQDELNRINAGEKEISHRGLNRVEGQMI